MRPNINNVINSDPFELLEWLEEDYGHIIPSGINSIEDMNMAGMLLGQLTNEYSYMTSLSTQLNLYVKCAKSGVMSKPKSSDSENMSLYLKQKEDYEVMRQRESVINCFANILKQQYSAVSRMLTIYIQTQEEIKMSERK